jgi:hypothetical protein
VSLFNLNFKNYHERKRSIRKLIFWSIVIAAFLALILAPTLTKAQVDLCESGIGAGCASFVDDYNQPGSTGFFNLLLDIAYFLIYIGVGVSVLFGVVGGTKMIVSNGDKDTYEKGLNTFKNAIIGMVVSIISLTVVSFVSQFLINFNL